MHTGCLKKVFVPDQPKNKSLLFDFERFQVKIVESVEKRAKYMIWNWSI